MKLFNRHIRITIFPALQRIFDERAEALGRPLSDAERLEIRRQYPPVVINRYPDQFTIKCSIISTINPVPSVQLVLDVTNLSVLLRFHILNSMYNRITVEAGYLGRNWNLGDSMEEGDLSILFKGALIWMGTQVEARKDIVTRFVGMAGKAEGLEAFSGLMGLNYSAGFNLWQLVNEVYRNSNNPDIRLNMSYEDREQILDTVSGVVRPTDLGTILGDFDINMTYDWEGTSSMTTEDWINLGSIGETIYIHDVNEKTGLINLPSLGNNNSITFKMALNTNIRMLEFVRLNNHDIQLPLVSGLDNLTRANTGNFLDREGIYRIVRIAYSLESRGAYFTMDVEAIARDVYNQILGKENN